MANSITNKIGCQTSGLKIVDPNDFDGFNSSSNMSVLTEDLNISVVLRTKKKGRTVLTKTGDSSTGTRESTSNIAINFIEGSDVSGQKVLTTKYTDLTTIFDKDVINNETLGITSIDIDFNSSMAPMININFVDVRGSSIFQNEENISGNNSANKYSTFFQLPYPIFELEIKGYYGKPVTYCLHMLKFSSKFNSKTGNFEIQCQFIGYTYAMLSDMLIGFLKAIPFTTIGASKFKDYKANSENPDNIITLVDLMRNISRINDGVKKLSSTSPNAVADNSIKMGIEKLGDITSIINFLGSELQYGHSTDKASNPETYEFIVKSSGDLTQPEIDSIKLYQDNVKKAIDEFNGMSLGVTLNVADFQSITLIGSGAGFYHDITKAQLSPTSGDIAADANLGASIGSTADLVTLKRNLLSYLDKNYSSIRDDYKFDVYDMNSLFAKLTTATETLTKSAKTVRENLALELKSTVREQLGFEPTVRNIIEIFTAAIETFMETIYEVSRRAEATTNNVRTGQLENKFGNDLVKTDIKKEYIDTKKFFAWPDYREKDEKTKTFVEKYLGSSGVLDNPKLVDEIDFIDDLLKAFLIAAEKSADVVNQMQSESTTWYPINPMDSQIFVDGEPYQRTQLSSNEDITRLMVIRGMTYLGYTNDETILSDDEIKAMAEIEAEAILRGVKSPTLKTSLTFVNLDYVKNIKGVINNISENVVVPKNDRFVYNYIYGKQPNGPNSVVIPISDTFTGNWPTKTSDLKIKADDGSTFLTNYSSDNYLVGKKVLDGGQYIKIIPINKLNGNSLISTTAKIKPDSVFSLDKMKSDKVDATAGFNSFGGTMGAQEYVNMDFGELDGLPLMYVFYKNSDNGMSMNRTNTGIEQKVPKNAPTSSVYDMKSSGFIPAVLGRDKDEAYEGKNGRHIVNNLGKNRDLFHAFVKNSDTSLTYPYVEQRFLDEDRSSYQENSFSLFGSQWYYNQDKARCVLSDNSQYNCEQYAKATLFLNTLPFNIDNEIGNPFGPNEIKHLFDKKGGFIHAPRLWCAYVGSILWRINDGVNLTTFKDPIIQDGKIIGGGSGKSDPFIWTKGKMVEDGQTVLRKYKAATRTEYFPNTLELIGTDSVDYPTIYATDIIINLPQQVKDAFKQVFFDFVNGTDEMISWDMIREKLEVWKGTGDAFNAFFVNLYKKTLPEGNGYKFNADLINNNTNFKNISNYQIVTYVTGLDDADALFLELKGDYRTNQAVTTLINALNQELIIVNNNYKIWTKDSNTSNDLYADISVSNKNFDLYFNTIINKIKESGSKFSDSALKKEFEQSLFGTTNEDTIKLLLYRTCKNIHDKWLAGVTDNNDIMYQCGGASGRSSVDAELGKRYGNASPKFIDSFRFVSRSFKDIGDKLYINPIPINEYLIEGVNSGAYDAISSLLAANGFDFIALPNFINYRDQAEVEAIFKPYGNYGEAISKGSCGPAFVSVYVGEPSKHLDFSNSEYTNDGMDLRCVNGGIDATSIPDDFTENLNSYEDGIGVFTVKYSQQNQNIFKDINLDQNEFTETNESLQIQDDISQKGSETNRTIAGQNIYNVYSVRSYTAEVEMMGNAMIQPMMYFQLDNIPMFHGGYMIKRVKHSIQPNSMSTSFSGTRIKFSETPLITALDLYMSMADNLNTESAGTGPVNIVDGVVSSANRSPKKSIGCSAIKKPVVSFEDTLRNVVLYLEGNYCSGGYNCGDDKSRAPRSGETLWGLDRKNHGVGKAIDNTFWTAVDAVKNTPRKWGQSYPNPTQADKLDSTLFTKYSAVIKKDFDTFMKSYFKTEALKQVILSDGRLYFNMVYAVYNGQGFFRGFANLLETAYASGTTTADGLNTVFVNERVYGGKNAYKSGTGNNLGNSSAILIANTGVDIGKLTGESKFC